MGKITEIRKLLNQMEEEQVEIEELKKNLESITCSLTVMGAKFEGLFKIENNSQAQKYQFRIHELLYNLFELSGAYDNLK